jgi:hypothetical protein
MLRPFGRGDVDDRRPHLGDKVGEPSLIDNRSEFERRCHVRGGAGFGPYESAAGKQRTRQQRSNEHPSAVSRISMK